ncbi:hypothetical protein [Streptomyces sp. NPDC005525]|uniref:hypothetical protein n=1 Tax=Streptomyces sp. NPDC005525 TaxID=3364720 RepID=UPI0036BC5F5E
MSASRRESSPGAGLRCCPGRDRRGHRTRTTAPRICSTGGNPVGGPHQFPYDLSGTASQRDAQIRHVLVRLIHWARCAGVAAVGIEDLDFTNEKIREKHGRRERFRQLFFGISPGKARPVSMAAGHGLCVVAVDPTRRRVP